MVAVGATGAAAGAALGGTAPAITAALAAVAAASWVLTAALSRGSRAARREAAHARALELLSDHANDTVLLVDGEGRIVRANARIDESHGWTRAEVEGLDVRALRAPDAAGQVVDDLARIRRAGSLRYETVHRRRDGATFPVEVSARGFEIGGEWFAQAIVRDVSQRARAEEALRRSQERLLHAQKMEAVGRLASGVAHDFNNLLVSILSCASFLHDALPEGDERRQDAAEIKASGERAAQLVRQLLAFGRKRAPCPEVVSLDRAVRRVESILRRTLGPAVTIHVETSARAHTRIDPGHLEQVIMNLAVNARDAMPAGGTLTIEAQDVEVESAPEEAACLAPGRYARLRVKDTGSGIPPEVLPKIFEPFFTTKEEGRGTGLGLATAYGIVEDAGGRIAVWSRPGEGSAFTVWFPASEPEEAREPAPILAPRVDPRWRGVKVLVVEDDEVVRRLACRVLAASGLEIAEAAGGAEAVQRLEADPELRLVVTDVMMPGMTGTELAAVVEERWPGVPVVLMSGFFASLRKPARLPVILKPFTPATLVGGVEASLAGRPRGDRMSGLRTG